MKIKLNFNELKVDSFTVNSDSNSKKGTIKGQAQYTQYIWCSDTCDKMDCYGADTINANTCDHLSVGMDCSWNQPCR
ncbi:MAG: hypothetical protein ACEPO8_08495 [Rhodothermaceae bacterium]